VSLDPYAPVAEAAPLGCAVHIRGLTHVYGRGEGAVVALSAIHLDIPAGGHIALMGPSGAGKSGGGSAPHNSMSSRSFSALREAIRIAIVDDDSLAWHEFPERPVVSMRRHRRFDVTPVDDVYEIDAFFRDSYWEPDGTDFLSPSLEEADLMRRILRPADFPAWFHRFLPSAKLSETRLQSGVSK